MFNTERIAVSHVTGRLCVLYHIWCPGNQAGESSARDSVVTAFGYNDIRLYALHRMTAAEVLPEKSRPPECFSLDAYLDSGALEFTNGETIVLEAWVQESLAAILRETPLGTDQTLEKWGERSLLRVTIKDSWQLAWWVLSQGEMIEILSPYAFRLQIADVASNMHSLYSDNRIEEEDEHS